MDPETGLVGRWEVWLEGWASRVAQPLLGSSPQASVHPPRFPEPLRPDGCGAAVPAGRSQRPPGHLSPGECGR